MSWPTHALVGTGLFAQVAVLDPEAPRGVSLSPVLDLVEQLARQAGQ